MLNVLVPFVRPTLLVELAGITCGVGERVDEEEEGVQERVEERR